jgi:hypothetical protein
MEPKQPMQRALLLSLPALLLSTHARFSFGC